MSPPSPDTSQLPPALQQAYRNALYQVDATKGAVAQTLRVGERNDWLEQQLGQQPIQAACYLTACNPWGQILEPAENARRMSALRHALDSDGWPYLDGCGQDPQGLWPGEASVLIWGMDAPTARAWGEQWEQNALLWCGADAIPQLLWLR
ncbi:DUF3293 domain-containing protein [Comamonas thiooxydans]|uniref:DUF3293 domain-containing protein n=1 Tax=Comamonas thiooxydans TaxID=363952 RepID=UPI000554F78A|nr:DUF3293 domain-containing protein [Comamonas thiooxydans]